MNLNFNKLLNFKLFLLLSWLGLVASINSSHYDLISLNLNLFNIINFLRYLAPIFIFSIFFILVLKNIQKLHFNKFFYFFILLGLIQFVSFFFNGYSLFDISRYHLLLSYFACIFILLFAYKINLDFKILYIIFISLLSAVVISYIYALIIQTIENGEIKYFYFIFSGFLQANEYGIIGQQNPRSTGLSRQMVIIFCFLFYLMNSLNSKKILYFSLLGILFFLSIFIWGFQSRGSLICWIIIWLVFLIFDKKKILSKLSLVLILVLSPILLFEYSKGIDNSKLAKKNRLFENQHFKVEVNVKDENTGETKLKSKVDYTTGRIYIWKRALKIFFEKPFLGYGPQGDRIALFKDKTNTLSTQMHIWDNNASNGIVYVGLSAGAIGIFILILIYILFLFNILKSLFLYKVFRSSNFFIKNCVTVIIIFVVRSIYENSFTVFSIDYIVVMLSFVYILKYFEKNNSPTVD